MARLTKAQLRATQIDQAMAKGAAESSGQLRAVAGYFDAESQKIVIEFESGVEYRFPHKLGQGLENASKTELANIEISPSGLGIHWPDIDVGFSIPHLLEGIYGTQKWMNAVMVNSGLGD